MLEELLLQWMQPLGRSESLDGADLLAVGLDGKDQAGIHQNAVDGDTAGATVAIVAALLGAGESQLFAQDLE